jgi:hypothetical protein
VRTTTRAGDRIGAYGLVNPNSSADQLRPLLHHDGPSSAGWGFGLITFIALAVLTPLLFTDLTLNSLARPEVMLNIGVIGYASLRLAQLTIRTGERIIQLTFWAFVYVFWGVAALAQLTTNTFPLTGRIYSSDAHVLALVNILLGLVAFDFGRMMSMKSGRGARLPGVLERLVVVPKRVWIIGGIGVISVAFFVIAEGIEVRFQSRAAAHRSLFGDDLPSGAAIAGAVGKTEGLLKASILWVPAFIGLYLLLAMRRSLRDGREVGNGIEREVPWIKSTGTAVFVSILLIANVIASNPLSNPRYRAGGVVLCLLAALIPLHKRGRFRWAVLGMVSLLLFAYPVADAFRYDQRDFSVAPLRETLISSPDYAMYQQHLNSLAYVELQGHTLGRQALGAALVFIPRSLWEAKPVSTGNLTSGIRAINASSSLWDEAFVDGGALGIFLTFVIYGWLLGLFEGAYVVRPVGDRSALSVAVPAFAAFQLFILRGSLQPVVGELLLVALLILACCKRFRGSGSAT